AAPPLSFGSAVPSPTDFYTVFLRGPLLESWRTQLASAGVQLLDARPNGGYSARLRTDQVQAVSALPFVERIEWISPVSSAPQISTRSVPGFGIKPPASGLKMLTFDLRLHDQADNQKMEAWLRARNVPVAGASGRKIRFFALEDAAVLDELAMQPEVDTVAEHKEPKLYNDYSRRLLAIDAATGANPSSFITQDGTDQIIAVADTGIDDAHPDFQGRIVGKVARGRPGDTSDPIGHGTHVAGSVLGDGAASLGQIKGVAP